MKKVIITTGGTGGHIYPALTLAKKLREKEVEVLFVGSDSRMEKEIVPKAGFEFYGLQVVALKRVGAFFKMLNSIFKAEKIIKEFEPDAVIGFGNYISVPVLFASWIHRKKIYLHEQNVKIGGTNRLFFRVANKFFVSFEETYYNIPIKHHKKVVMSGNPTREEFYKISREEERKRFKIAKDEKMLLIVGGSLGAKSINEAMLAYWEEIFKENGLRIYWSTGKNNYDEIISKIGKMKGNDVVKPYFENMPNLMAAADLIISRAGASIITEIIAMGKASILIPYNYIGQADNAKVLLNQEAALVYSDDKSSEAIKEALELVFDRDKLKEIEGNIRSLRHGNGCDKIVEELDIWRN